MELPCSHFWTSELNCKAGSTHVVSTMKLGQGRKLTQKKKKEKRFLIVLLSLSVEGQLPLFFPLVQGKIDCGCYSIPSKAQPVNNASANMGVHIHIGQKWKQLKCPSTDAWKKTHVVHIQNSLVVRKEDILPVVTTWLDLEYITLSKINQKTCAV